VDRADKQEARAGRGLEKACVDEQQSAGRRADALTRKIARSPIGRQAGKST
jgi:hypothetical protein